MYVVTNAFLVVVCVSRSHNNIFALNTMSENINLQVGSLFGWRCIISYAGISDMSSQRR